MKIFWYEFQGTRTTNIVDFWNLITCENYSKRDENDLLMANFRFECVSHRHVKSWCDDAGISPEFLKDSAHKSLQIQEQNFRFKFNDSVVSTICEFSKNNFRFVLMCFKVHWDHDKFNVGHFEVILDFLFQIILIVSFVVGKT